MTLTVGMMRSLFSRVWLQCLNIGLKWIYIWSFYWDCVLLRWDSLSHTTISTKSLIRQFLFAKLFGGAKLYLKDVGLFGGQCTGGDILYMGRKKRFRVQWWRHCSECASTNWWGLTDTNMLKTQECSILVVQRWFSIHTRVLLRSPGHNNF